jgi:hypothetical protein
MPLLVLSLCPLVVCVSLGNGSMHVVLLSLFNAIASSGDVLAIILVLAQVPPDAVIRRDDEITAWRRVPAPGQAVVDGT